MDDLGGGESSSGGGGGRSRSRPDYHRSGSPIPGYTGHIPGARWVVGESTFRSLRKLYANSGVDNYEDEGGGERAPFGENRRNSTQNMLLMEASPGYTTGSFRNQQQQKKPDGFDEANAEKALINSKVVSTFQALAPQQFLSQSQKCRSCSNLEQQVQQQERAGYSNREFFNQPKAMEAPGSKNGAGNNNLPPPYPLVDPFTYYYGNGANNRDNVAYGNGCSCGFEQRQQNGPSSGTNVGPFSKAKNAGELPQETRPPQSQTSSTGVENGDEYFVEKVSLKKGKRSDGTGKLCQRRRHDPAEASSTLDDLKATASQHIANRLWRSMHVDSRLTDRGERVGGEAPETIPNKGIEENKDKLNDRNDNSKLHQSQSFNNGGIGEAVENLEQLPQNVWETTKNVAGRALRRMQKTIDDNESLPELDLNNRKPEGSFYSLQPIDRESEKPNFCLKEALGDGRQQMISSTPASGGGGFETRTMSTPVLAGTTTEKAIGEQANLHQHQKTQSSSNSSSSTSSTPPTTLLKQESSLKTKPMQQTKSASREGGQAAEQEEESKKPQRQKHQDIGDVLDEVRAGYWSEGQALHNLRNYARMQRQGSVISTRDILATEAAIRDQVNLSGGEKQVFPSGNGEPLRMVEPVGQNISYENAAKTTDYSNAITPSLLDSSLQPPPPISYNRQSPTAAFSTLELSASYSTPPPENILNEYTLEESEIPAPGYSGHLTELFETSIGRPFSEAAKRSKKLQHYYHDQLVRGGATSVAGNLIKHDATGTGTGSV